MYIINLYTYNDIFLIINIENLCYTWRYADIIYSNILLYNFYILVYDV